MRPRGERLLVVVVAVAAMAALVPPALVQADLVCPECKPELVRLTSREVVTLVVATIMTKGVSLFIMGATAVVGAPWVVAGFAIAAVFYVPRWLK